MEKLKDKQFAKREVLLKTSKIMNYNGFRDLRSLYINFLPYSIKVETPIQMFHYLDCVGCLSVKELAHNLRSMGYRDSIKDLERYIELYEAKTNVQNRHPGEIVKILKNGLRNSDISELGFIFNKNYGNNLENLMIDVCSYAFGMYLEPRHILNLLTTYGKQDVIAVLKSNVQKSDFSQNQHECYTIEERVFILNLARDIDTDESLQSFMFFYKIPISSWEKIKNGFDLFQYLYSKGTINLQKLGEYGTLTNFATLACKIQKFLKSTSKKTSYDSCSCEHIFNFRTLLIRAKDAIYNLSNPNLIFDFIAHLLGNLPPETVDMTKLAMLLVTLQRFDIVRSLNRMDIGKLSKDVPEGAGYTREEFRIFQLKFKLDEIMIGKLASLYGINLPFNYSGEFLTYLCTHKLADISVLKANLKKIGKPELIPLLDCYE